MLDTEPEQAAAGSTPGGSETILLVEDEEAVRELARRVLEEAGCTVLVAMEGPFRPAGLVRVVREALDARPPRVR